MIKIEDPDINEKGISSNVKDIVWALIHYSKRTGESIDQALSLFKINKDQYDKYKNSYPDK